jgi:hypothetical protein
MATSSDFFHPRELQLRVASEPVGPWSAPARVAVPEVPGKTTDLVYCTYLHPELETADGLLLTFCRMLRGEWELTNPETVRVRLRS